MGTRKYDPESIRLALDVHRQLGLIRDWRPNRRAGWRGGVERPFSVLVDLVDGESDFEIRTIREAAVFVAGLASAHRATLRDDAADLCTCLEDHGRQFHRSTCSVAPGQPLRISAAQLREVFGG